jgi:hypothetical protein
MTRTSVVAGHSMPERAKSGAESVVVELASVARTEAERDAS